MGGGPRSVEAGIARLRAANVANPEGSRALQRAKPTAENPVHALETVSQPLQAQPSQRHLVAGKAWAQIERFRFPGYTPVDRRHNTEMTPPRCKNVWSPAFRPSETRLQSLRTA